MVVYTVITNGKDQHVNMIREPDVRYICFSDKPFSHPLWEYRPIEPLGLTDNRRIARRYKWLSHLYFPGEKTIWLDGRVILNKVPSEMFRIYQGDIAARPHPMRTCIYDEAEVIISQNYDHEYIVRAQMNKLRSAGYPERNGLHETGCLVRRPNRTVEAFNERMWAWISAGSKRDQLVFDYLAWQMDINVSLMNRNDVRVLTHRVKTNVDQ